MYVGVCLCNNDREKTCVVCETRKQNNNKQKFN